jgi:acetyl esterase
LVRELANKANVVIVFVNYTPSPQARYPVAVEQAYAATKWVAENGRTINVNSSRLAVVGDSVGGNMVAAVTLLAKLLLSEKGNAWCYYGRTAQNYEFFKK